MNILLVIPINRSYVIIPSLGLGYLAGILRRDSSVSILHCIKERFNYVRFKDFINKNRFDLIGFQMMSYDLLPVREHIRIIRESQNKTCIIVAGGPHPSGDPAGTLNFLNGLDFAFKGEAEKGVYDFVRFNKSARMDENNLKVISGLIWRKNDRIIENRVDYIDDLDTIPFPAWDIIKPARYPLAPHGAFYKRFPAAPIILTRGCSSKCTFCAGKSITGNKVRRRGIENVVDEMKYLLKDFGIYEFMVEDENLTLHRELTMNFAKKLINDRLNIYWSCPSGIRLDTIDLEMLRLMEKSGCHSLAVGIEFGSQRILDLTKKRLKLEIIKEKIKMIRNTNIKITGFFMMGIPGETVEEMYETIKFSRQLDIDRAQFNNFMPLPGSQIYEELKNKNALKEIDTRHFFVHDVGYVPEGLTARKMKSLQKRAYLGFYFRFSILSKIVKEVRNLPHFMKLLYRFWDAMT